MVSWESAALVAAVFTGLGGIMGAFFYGLHKIVYSIKSSSAEQTMKVEQAVTQANGTPLLLVRNSRTPMWYKKYKLDDTGRPEFRTAFVNSSYTKLFGVTLEEYSGKTDFDVWPDSVAQQYYLHDVRVLHSGIQMEFIEMIDGEEWCIIKYPYRDSVSGVVLGVGGEAHRTSLPESSRSLAPQESS